VIVRVMTLIAFVTYFVCTLIWVLPLNPIQLATHRVLGRTFARYFSQNWRLFAPDPVSSNDSLLAACLPPADTRTPGEIGASEWYDLSTPLWRAFEGNRLTAYDRVIRPQTHAARAFLSGSLEMHEWSDSCRRGNKDACDYIKDELEAIRKTSSEFLRRIASAACSDLRGAGNTARIALRIRERTGAPWSERYTGKDKIRDIELGVVDADPSVAAANIYTKLTR
jgi:Family of unknown function (DUF5819)